MKTVYYSTALRNELTLLSPASVFSDTGLTGIQLQRFRLLLEVEISAIAMLLAADLTDGFYVA